MADSKKRQKRVQKWSDSPGANGTFIARKNMEKTDLNGTDVHRVRAESGKTHTQKRKITHTEET